MLAPLGLVYTLGMEHDVVSIHELATELRLPHDWLRREADAGRIPCLRVGRRRLFNISAVRKALAIRAGKCGVIARTRLPNFQRTEMTTSAECSTARALRRLIDQMMVEGCRSDNEK